MIFKLLSRFWSKKYRRSYRLKIYKSYRTFSKALQLADQFKEFGAVRAVEMESVNTGYDVVINSTSASLDGQLPQISPAIFQVNTVSYDMMYGKGNTVFNQWAVDNGCASAYDGLGMLVGQAAESFMLWRGLRPGTRQILFELRRNLEGL